MPSTGLSGMNDLADPVFDGVGLASSKSRANFGPKQLAPILSSTVFSFISLFL